MTVLVVADSENARRKFLGNGNMIGSQTGNPLHGITLEQILTQLVEKLGWVEMGKRVQIRCFTTDPSIKSSLKFLRKTPWAREKVEALYLNTQGAHSDFKHP